MPSVTIPNLSEATYSALKARAARHRCSVESEMRDILEAAVRPETRLRMGTALAEIGQRLGLTEEDVTALDQAIADNRKRTV